MPDKPPMAAESTPIEGNGQDRAEIVFNVLGYREGEEWVALALEMDLRGYGETFEAALDELVEIVEMQISFAVQKGMPEMVLEPAEAVWFERWAEVRRKRLSELWTRSGDSVPDEDYRLSAIPPPHVLASLAEFSQVDA